MNRKSLSLFQQFLKTGGISREENPEAYADWKDGDAAAELQEMGEVLGFRLFERGTRVYFIPDSEGELFAQNNTDIRESIGMDARNVDVFLNNYIIITILYLFYHSKNNDPRSRDVVAISDLIEELDRRMRNALENPPETEQKENRYGINFFKIAQTWLAKEYGEKLSTRRSDKTGCVRKACIKLRNQKLIRLPDDETMIFPTVRLDDLMEYYLQQDRVKQIDAVFEGVEEDADNLEDSDRQLLL
jgi:hypothetical protein